MTQGDTAQHKVVENQHEPLTISTFLPQGWLHLQ